MRFWDTSCVLPLILAETASNTVRSLRHADPDLVVWWGTRIECVSALSRRSREQAFEAEEWTRLNQRLHALYDHCFEIEPSEELRTSAEYMLHAHPLRAADSLQLAAALIWANAHGPGAEFVSLDTRLRTAAAREGLTVLP